METEAGGKGYRATASPEYGEVLRAIALHDMAKSRAKRMVFLGIVWLVGGVAVSTLSYIGAEPGESYFVFWGAALFGVYKFLRGIYYMVNPLKLLR